MFVIGGHKLAGSRKYRSVVGGSTRVSLILEDLASVEPWMPRGIKAHGVAIAERRMGQFGQGDYLMIRLVVSWNWGIEARASVAGASNPTSLFGSRCLRRCANSDWLPQEQDVKPLPLVLLQDRTHRQPTPGKSAPSLILFMTTRWPSYDGHYS